MGVTARTEEEEDPFHVILERLKKSLRIESDSALSTEDLKYLTRIHYYGRVDGSPFAEHEIDYILFLQKDLPISPNPEEVKAVEYVKKEHFPDYIKSLESKNIPITPWFRVISQHFLLQWWNNLENLNQFTDHETIHHF